MKKVLKIISRIFIVFLLIIALALLACFFYQRSEQKKDRGLLVRDGFCNLVSAGDYNMNINIFGDGKYKIIAMPGSGDSAFPIDMKKFSEHLSDDISLVVVSRPGYGLCEETDHDITPEYIVDTTRTALKNAGIEGPYILMPHSLSGIYGTYWESTYPDEVSGVIFLDSVNEGTLESTEEDLKSMESSASYKFFLKSGIMRFVADRNGMLDDMFSSYGEYSKDAIALYCVNISDLSKSIRSEGLNFNSNMKSAWAAIRTNDIPKIYISTNYQTIDDVRDCLMFHDGEVDEEKAKEWFEHEQSETEVEYRKKRSEYIEKVGNCEEINIPGLHAIFDQKPDEVAKEIDKFIEKIK